MRALLPLVVVIGCSGGSVGEPAPSEENNTSVVVIPANGIDGMPGVQAALYLRKLAPMIVGRVLTTDERSRLERDGGAAIEPILTAWGEEPGFVARARERIEMELAVGGSQGAIDFGLPGNTVAKVVRDREPWSTILTASTCYDAEGAPIACDTGAPYTAGLLTTRAYMASHRGRFNLSRARTMLSTFACQKYPLADGHEPRIDKTHLIPMFRATSPEEQTEDAARAGFGNGLACYSCHGQFGRHAQLFVKFDESGLWVEGATGLQSTAEGAEIGRSDDGLMTSHLVVPEEASSEASQWFGTPVSNLAGAAAVLGSSIEFHECTARNLLTDVLGLASGADVSSELLASVIVDVRKRNVDPTYQEIVTATFAHPKVAFTALNEFQSRSGTATTAEEGP
ncbi:MAG: hypothetical protein R3A78_04695 [Polyangiales bacterium]